MSYYDYKVVSAPRRSKKAKGVNQPAELFALTLTEAINEHARDGWEYVRAETLPAQAPGGWFKRAAEENVTVMIFRRERESLMPRLESVPGAFPAGHVHTNARADRAAAAPEQPQPAAASARPMPERIHSVSRREPVFSAADDQGDDPSPLRPTPRLGPIEGS
jgi:hypothetical protein